MTELEKKRLEQVVNRIKIIEGYKSLNPIGRANKAFVADNGDFILVNETGKQDTRVKDFNFGEIPGGNTAWNAIVENPVGYYYVVTHIDDELTFYKAEIKNVVESRSKNPWAQAENKSRGGKRRYTMGINFKDAIEGKETMGIRAGGPGRPWLFDVNKVHTETFSFKEKKSSNPEEKDNEFFSKVKEGKKIKVYTTRYERKASIRKKVIEAKGCTCCVCGINFEDVYGELGNGFIHVHHNKPICEGERVSQSIDDFDVVCPNCHAMLHRQNGKVFTVTELKEMLEAQKHKKLRGSK